MQAIGAAERALETARDNYELIGITLLYSSAARSGTHLPNHQFLAVRDCDRAIRLLSLIPFNQAIANVIRAQLELLHHKDAEQRDAHRSALVYFDRADMILRRLIKDEHEHNRHANLDRYNELRAEIAKQIAEISRSIAAVTPIVIPPKIGVPTPPPPTTPPPAPARPTPAPAARPMIRLPIPTRLLWPVPQPAVNLELRPNTSGVVPDVQITQLLINQQPYRIDPLDIVAVPPGPYHLRAHTPYTVMPLFDTTQGQAVLVRQQPCLDRDRQLVAIYDPSTRSAYVDEAESTAPYTHIHVIGISRDWVEDGTINPIILGNPQIIGIVEALLTP
jgi:hypothetical protein